MSKKKYTDEQKAKVVALLTLGEKSSKIAKETGVNANTVRYMKANLKKIQRKDGTLGYYFEEQKNLVGTLSKGIKKGAERVVEALNTVKIETPKDIRDIMVTTGIMCDKVERILRQFQPSPTRGKAPSIDLSEWSVEEIKIARLKLKKIIESSAPQLENGEVIEGESREID